MKMDKFYNFDQEQCGHTWLARFAGGAKYYCQSSCLFHLSRNWSDCDVIDSKKWNYTTHCGVRDLVCVYIETCDLSRCVHA